MVIAGPGTGKTTILTLRIANILRKASAPPDGVLALTFTDSGVVAMRKKLVALIGPSAYRVGLFTFHGFAEDIIKKYPEYFPRIIGGDVATESERLSIVEKIIEEGDFDLVRPFGSPLHYVKGSLDTISELKRDNINPEDFVKILKKEEKLILSYEDLKHTKGRYKGEIKGVYKDSLKNIKKNHELAKLFESYELALRAQKLYDFDDMLLELLKAFKTHTDLLQSIQEKYLYFLADEHQDANNAQNSILEKLSENIYNDDPNLFIVGDEKQAIYRFQGASLENFLYFKNKFKTAKLIHLDENYRSHQSILDASHIVADSLPGDLSMRPKLKAKNEEMRGKIEVVSFNSENDEALGIVEKIKNELKEGTKPEDVAVLVRTNKEISDLGKFLINADIPTTLLQDDDVLSDPDVAKLILLMRAINNPASDELVAEVLFLDFIGHDPIEVIKAIDEARKNKKKMVEVIERFEKFNTNFKSWITLSKNASALELMTAVLADSNFTTHLLKKAESIEKMALLSALYEEVASRQVHKKEASLADFLRDIETLETHGAKLTFASRIRKEHTVKVLTAHKSKGLEWKMVVIPHAVSGKWGSKRSMSSFKLPEPLGSARNSGKEEDERRLFYVALTRAKDRILITYSNHATDGKDLVASQFIEELPVDLVKREIGIDQDPSGLLLSSLTSRLNKENTLWDKEYLREKFVDQGLNATAINNYIECPWKYFFTSLIRIPDSLKKHQMYGTSMHHALSMMTNSLRLEKEFGLEDLLKSFEENLDHQPMSAKDFNESLKKGKKALKALWSSEREHWHIEALSEFNIPGVHLGLSKGEVLLRGRLDKIDMLNDKEVRVIDFKTGRPKSRNEILGETQSSTGNEKRQLDFYKLILDLFDDGKYNMTHGEIMFTEPDEKGRIKKEVFEITNEDKERIKDETIRIAEEIQNFTFWDKKCTDKECEFCKRRRLVIG